MGFWGFGVLGFWGGVGWGGKAHDMPPQVGGLVEAAPPRSEAEDGAVERRSQRNGSAICQ